MTTNDKLALIPEVSEIKPSGSFFTLKNNCSIGVSHKEIIGKGTLLAQYLNKLTGVDCSVSEGGGCPINLILTEGKADMADEFDDETYTVDVEEEKCTLAARTQAGLARAVQTVRQMFALAGERTIPGCRITDSPRFNWRGLHLDVGRHFFSKEEIKLFIDNMALYKFNRFHFHLTEDQGWRLEIKKYPKLTEKGAYRDSTLIGLLSEKPKRYDDKPYGGYYTQDEIREIVAYAEEREIVIIPEIDMPGHMQAAISAYPELGCTDQTLKPLCHWGVSQHILNVEQSTVDFMKDVLDEVMELFPGRYIHIGGDEAAKYEWEEQRRIQDRMAELGLKGEAELQSWFIRQMAGHIQSRGREVIGWDEILEGGLAPGTAVMSWRGEEGGIEAASKGHKVVMTPEKYVYFDYYQGEPEKEPLAIGGYTPLEKVYNYEVLPEEMPEDQHHLVMGSQGQLWTEYIRDFSYLEYMAYPRACALSENLWIDKERKNLESFLERLEEHKTMLSAMNVNFRK